MSKTVVGAMTDIAAHLDHVKKTEGEPAWRREITRLVRKGIKAGGKEEKFWRSFAEGFPWLDVL